MLELLARQLPVDVQMRIVGLLSKGARRRVRCTSVALRDLIRTWECALTGPVVYAAIRLMWGHQALQQQLPPPNNDKKKKHVFYLRSNLNPETMRFIQGGKPPYLTPDGIRLFLQQEQATWEHSLRTLCRWFEKAAGVGHITRWRFTCVTPIYGYPISPDAFLTPEFCARLMVHLGGMVALERLHVRLCSPSNHYNDASKRICCPRHGPVNLGQSTFARVVLRPALGSAPSMWPHLTHLTLTDQSFHKNFNGHELVELLLLVLTRDSALVASLEPFMTGYHTREFQLRVGALSRPAVMRHVCLDGIRLATRLSITSRFWMSVGAFPPQELVLRHTQIELPCALDLHLATGTIFPEAFYTTPKSVRIDTMTNDDPLPLRAHAHMRRRFRRDDSPEQLVVVELGVRVGGYVDEDDDQEE